MHRLMVINGPNLNLLGQRDAELYGSMSLSELEVILYDKGKDLGMKMEFFQSNSEGSIIDYLQGKSADMSGIIINPGALTHYGYSLRDALSDVSIPIVEVHLTNIYSREPWRHHSVIAGVSTGQITGFGWAGYVAALDLISTLIHGHGTDNE